MRPRGSKFINQKHFWITLIRFWVFHELWISKLRMGISSFLSVPPPCAASVSAPPRYKASPLTEFNFLSNLLQTSYESSRCIDNAKSLNNKISRLEVKKCYSRRLILQFLGINPILCYAATALAAPIMDMNEPQVIRFVCLLFHFIYLF